MDAALKGLAVYVESTPKVQVEEIAEAAQVLSDKMPDNEKLAYMAQNLADALKKSAESAEKSAESSNNEISMRELSRRQSEYSSD